MLRTRAGSWIVALAMAALPWVPCSRAVAQEPPAATPEDTSEQQPERPAARAQPGLRENSAPEPTPKRTPRAGDVQKVFVIKNVHVRPLAEVLAVFPATITFSTYERSSALGISGAEGSLVGAMMA